MGVLLRHDMLTQDLATQNINVLSVKFDYFPSVQTCTLGMVRGFFLSTQDKSKFIANYAFLSGALYYMFFCASPRKYCHEDNGSNLNAL